MSVKQRIEFLTVAHTFKTSKINSCKEIIDLFFSRRSPMFNLERLWFPDPWHPRKMRKACEGFAST